ALGEEVVDMEGLVRPDPRVDALVEDADHFRVRVRVEPAADGARPEPAALQDAGRVARAGGQHDERGVGMKAPSTPAVLADEAAAHAGRLRAAAEHAVDARVGHERGPGG